MKPPMEATAPKTQAIIVTLPATAGAAWLPCSNCAGKDVCELFPGVRVVGVSAGVALSEGVTAPTLSSARLFLLKYVAIAEFE
jgi:hypothetical protein